ncbi:activating transcription factor 7-interacting protein 1 isoform X3 [Denticeps clupeoides]|uniref:activating transcription factor 7-interacting protein 1 isoform X3 n=1 Tax=Denticeps clupeoides TaxID=299321 RepID=UPI0010A2D0E0|nr:activating transcription factor 7-interacting protein 1-like isoform X3 [Denticeps clupeoides]
MEVAVPEEPQKKIFRARKTMKMSDRQQLEVLHNTLATTSAPSNSSSPSQTPLVNGMHSEDGNKNSEKSKKRESRARSPDLPSVCLQSYPLTQSQTSSSAANSANPSQSLKVTTKESEKGEKSKDGLSKKLEREEDEAKKSDKSEEKETEESRAKPKKTRSTSPTSACQKNGAEKDSKEDTVAMDTEATPSVPVEKTCRSSSSRSSSPSAGIESDQEVKEGFLFLSEEEENMGEKDDGKEMNEDKMDVDGSKGKKKREDNQTSQSSTPAASTGRNTPTAKKRGLSQDADKNEQKDGDETTRGVKVGKRARVDGVELEAQLAVKIMANSDTRLKLEKVVQKLVEERLRVWELTVFDRNLQELKERVEKMDCATKHQNSLNTLQAKIARLDKKFVAANQAKENSKRPQDAQTNSTVKTTPPVNTTLVQRNVRTTVDTKTNQGQAVAADNSTAKRRNSNQLSDKNKSMRKDGRVLSDIGSFLLKSSQPVPDTTVCHPAKKQPILKMTREALKVLTSILDEGGTCTAKSIHKRLQDILNLPVSFTLVLRHLKRLGWSCDRINTPSKLSRVPSMETSPPHVGVTNALFEKKKAVKEEPEEEREVVGKGKLKKSLKMELIDLEEVQTNDAAVSLAVKTEDPDGSPGDCGADEQRGFKQKCHPDITFSSLMPEDIDVLMIQSRGRPDRYACLVFRAVVPDVIYSEWVLTTNWDGTKRKRGLPLNLKDYIMQTVQERFPQFNNNDRQRIKDRINEFLRSPRNTVLPRCLYS